MTRRMPEQHRKRCKVNDSQQKGHKHEEVFDLGLEYLIRLFFKIYT